MSVNGATVEMRQKPADGHLNEALDDDGTDLCGGGAAQRHVESANAGETASADLAADAASRDMNIQFPSTVE